MWNDQTDGMRTPGAQAAGYGVRTVAQLMIAAEATVAGFRCDPWLLIHHG